MSAAEVKEGDEFALPVTIITLEVSCGLQSYTHWNTPNLKLDYTNTAYSVDLERPIDHHHHQFLATRNTWTYN